LFGPLRFEACCGAVTSGTHISKGCPRHNNHNHHRHSSSPSLSLTSPSIPSTTPLGVRAPLSLPRDSRRPSPSHDSSTSHLLAHHSHQPAHHKGSLYRGFSNMARRGAVQRSTETVQDEGAATPALISPPESKTPPTASHKRNKSVSRNSEAVDASALSKALKDFEQAGKARERTPIASPSRKRPRIQGDR
jgi:hypothetical protein